MSDEAKSGAPPVPIKTYQWEDLRREKIKGRYPWTHIIKGPYTGNFAMDEDQEVKRPAPEKKKKKVKKVVKKSSPKEENLEPTLTETSSKADDPICKEEAIPNEDSKEASESPELKIHIHEVPGDLSRSETDTPRSESPAFKVELAQTPDVMGSSMEMSSKMDFEEISVPSDRDSVAPSVASEKDSIRITNEVRDLSKERETNVDKEIETITGSSDKITIRVQNDVTDEVDNKNTESEDTNTDNVEQFLDGEDTSKLSTANVSVNEDLPSERSVELSKPSTSAELDASLDKKRKHSNASEITKSTLSLFQKMKNAKFKPPTFKIPKFKKLTFKKAKTERRPSKSEEITPKQKSSSLTRPKAGSPVYIHIPLKPSPEQLEEEERLAILRMKRELTPKLPSKEPSPVPQRAKTSPKKEGKSLVSKLKGFPTKSKRSPPSKKKDAKNTDTKKTSPKSSPKTVEKPKKSGSPVYIYIPLKPTSDEASMETEPVDLVEPTEDSELREHFETEINGTTHMKVTYIPKPKETAIDFTDHSTKLVRKESAPDDNPSSTTKEGAMDISDNTSAAKTNETETPVTPKEMPRDFIDELIFQSKDASDVSEETVKPTIDLTNILTEPDTSRDETPIETKIELTDNSTAPDQETAIDDNQEDETVIAVDSTPVTPKDTHRDFIDELIFKSKDADDSEVPIKPTIDLTDILTEPTDTDITVPKFTRTTPYKETFIGPGDDDPIINPITIRKETVLGLADDDIVTTIVECKETAIDFIDDPQTENVTNDDITNDVDVSEQETLTATPVDGPPKDTVDSSKTPAAQPDKKEMNKKVEKLLETTSKLGQDIKLLASKIKVAPAKTKKLSPFKKKPKKGSPILTKQLSTEKKSASLRRDGSPKYIYIPLKGPLQDPEEDELDKTKEKSDESEGTTDPEMPALQSDETGDKLNEPVTDYVQILNKAIENLELNPESVETPQPIETPKDSVPESDKTGAKPKQKTMMEKGKATTEKITKDLKKLASKLKELKKLKKPQKPTKKVGKPGSRKIVGKKTSPPLQKKSPIHKKRSDSPVEYIHIPLKGPLPEVAPTDEAHKVDEVSEQTSDQPSQETVEEVKPEPEKIDTSKFVLFKEVKPKKELPKISSPKKSKAEPSSSPFNSLKKTKDLSKKTFQAVKDAVTPKDRKIVKRVEVHTVVKKSPIVSKKKEDDYIIIPLKDPETKPEPDVPSQPSIVDSASIKDDTSKDLEIPTSSEDQNVSIDDTKDDTSFDVSEIKEESQIDVFIPEVIKEERLVSKEDEEDGLKVIATIKEAPVVMKIEDAAIKSVLKTVDSPRMNKKVCFKVKTCSEDDDTVKEVKKDDAPKELKKDDTVKEVKKDNTLKEVKDDTLKEVKKDDTLKEVKKDDTLKVIKKDDTVKDVKKDDTLKELKKDDTVKEVKKDDAVKKMTNDDAATKPKEEKDVAEVRPDIKDTVKESTKEVKPDTNKESTKDERGYEIIEVRRDVEPKTKPLLEAAQSMSVEEEKCYLDKKIIKNSSLDDDYSKWSKAIDHEYEPINPPSTPAAQAPQIQLNAQALSTPAAENRMLRIPLDRELVVDDDAGLSQDESISTQGQLSRLEDRYLTSPECSRTEEINTSQIDSSALEHLPLKKENRKQAMETQGEGQQGSNIQQSLRNHTEKLKTRIKNIKRPTFTINRAKKPEVPKIKQPSRFQRPKFKAPSFPKAPNLPKAPKFNMPKMPDRPKINFPSFSLPRASKRERPTSTESSAGSKNIFDFRTYPRLFKKKEAAEAQAVDEEVDPDTQFATVPPKAQRKKGPVGARWVHRFTDIKFVDEDTRRPGGSDERSDSLERRMEEDRRYKEALEADEQLREYEKENREIHSTAALPSRWSHGSFHQYNDEPEDENSEAPRINGDLDNNISERSSIGSSGSRRRQGVLEEIDSDQFFLREKGISQDNIQVGLYLSSEIRDAFKTPVNTLEQIESRPYHEYDLDASEVSLTKPRRPKRKHLKKTKRVKKTPHASQEEIQDDQESINTEPEEYPRNYKTFPPARPKRVKKPKLASEENLEADIQLTRSEEEMDNEDLRDETSSREALMYENEVMQNIEQPEIIVQSDQKETTIAHFGMDQKDIDRYLEDTGRVETPKPPTRRNKSMRSLNISEHDSILGEFNKDRYIDDMLDREIKVYRTEHEYIVPSLEEPPMAPKRRSRSRSRGESQADDDRTSRGAESIVSECQEPVCAVELRDSMGYAIIDKHRNREAQPAPPKRRRSTKSNRSNRSTRSNKSDTKFFTVPRNLNDLPPSRPTRNYSTLGPSRPPRRKSIPDGEGEEKENLQADVTQYIEIEDDDHSRDLQSGDIINKMKTRPLPAPPRPPRKSRDSSREPLQDITHEENIMHEDLDDKEHTSPASAEEAVIEIEVSTQTDPLPEDFCCEEMIEEPTDRIVAPTRRRRSRQESLSRSKPERPQSPLQRSMSPNAMIIERKVQTPTEMDGDETVTHASILVRPVAEYPPDSCVSKRFGADIPAMLPDADIIHHVPIPDIFTATLYHEEQSLQIDGDTSDTITKDVTEQEDTTDYLQDSTLRLDDICDPYECIPDEEEIQTAVTPEIPEKPARSKVQSAVDIDDVDVVPEIPQKPQRSKLPPTEPSAPPQPQIIERIIERPVPFCVTPGSDTEVEVLKAQRLQVTDLDVERLNVSELQAGKIIVSEIDGVTIQISELTSKTGGITVNGLEIPSGLIQEILDRLQPLTQAQGAPPVVREQVSTQTDVLTKSSLETQTSIESLPTPVEVVKSTIETQTSTETPSIPVEEVIKSTIETQTSTEIPPIPEEEVVKSTIETQTSTETPPIPVEEVVDSTIETQTSMSPISEIVPASMGELGQEIKTELGESQAQITLKEEEAVSQEQRDPLEAVASTEHSEPQTEQRIAEQEEGKIETVKSPSVVCESIPQVAPEVERAPRVQSQPNVTQSQLLHGLPYSVTYHPEYVPSVPPPSFYMLHSRPHDLSEEDIPVRRRHRQPSRSTSEEEETERRVVHKRHGTRSGEHSIPDLTGQLARQCTLTASRVIKQICSCVSAELSTPEGRRNAQIALLIFIVVIAGLILLGFGGGKTIHYHHWEYFNPPTDT